MSNVNNRIKSQKQWPAILIALGMTFALGLVILTLGVNAFSNQNVAPVQTTSLPDTSLSRDQAKIEELQNLISQYQAREQQYQTELQQAADQLNQTSNELQQYQGLVTTLQYNGIIQITSDGQVFIGRSPSNGERHNEFDDDD